VRMVTDWSDTTLTMEIVGMVAASAVEPVIDSIAGTRIAKARMMDMAYFIAGLLSIMFAHDLMGRNKTCKIAFADWCCLYIIFPGTKIINKGWCYCFPLNAITWAIALK
jgi:hypothetical protein